MSRRPSKKAEPASDEAFGLYPDTSSVPQRGRGTKSRIEFSQRYADLICSEIADGKSLRTITEADDMPARATVQKWLNEHPGFADQYARARELQQDAYADEIVHIADTEADPNKARVRIDARKWHASKLAPKKYGDKVDVGIDGKLTIQVVKLADSPDPE